MNLFEFERILNRYLKGKATEEEKQFIEHWLTIREADQQKMDEQEHYQVKNAIWTGIGRRTGLSGELNQMRSIRRMIPYAAAITLLLIGMIWLYHRPGHHTQKFLIAFTTAKGEKKTIRLSDSTLVHLFPGSSLAIADQFNANDRQVSVTGRAFFEVRNNAVKPFIVKAGKLQTTVLGTSFEVMQADSAENIITVSSGKVSVAWNAKQLGTISAGMRLRYAPATGESHTEEVNSTALTE